jgi:hypothetical protein
MGNKFRRGSLKPPQRARIALSVRRLDYGLDIPVLVSR